MQPRSSSSPSIPESNAREYGIRAEGLDMQSSNSLDLIRKRAQDSMEKLIISINNPNELENEVKCMRELLDKLLNLKRAKLHGYNHAKNTPLDPNPALPPQSRKRQATMDTPSLPALNAKRPTQGSVSADASSEMQVPERRMQKRRRVPEIVSFEDAVRVAQSMKDGPPAITETDHFVRVREAVVRKATEAGTMAGRNATCSTLKFDDVDMYIITWAKIFGREGTQRLAALMKDIRSTGEFEVNPIGSRPVLGATSSQPTLVQNVIDAYRLQSATQTTAMTKKYIRYIHAADFYRQYRDLCGEAADDNTETGQLFKTLGLKTAVGVSYPTLVNDYLLYCLKDFGLNINSDPKDPLHKEREQARMNMRNEVALSQSYYTIRNEFGPGVFALLLDKDFPS